MDQKMFCFQCEQTAGCAGCKGNAGVCGKKSDTANLQDKLTGALIGLARTIADGNAKPTDSTYRTIIDGLFFSIFPTLLSFVFLLSASNIFLRHNFLVTC